MDNYQAEANYFLRHTGQDIGNLLDAIREYPVVILNASPGLLKEKYFLLDAANANGNILKFLQEPITTDREVVIEAVKNKGEALGLLNASLRADPEIVYHAVQPFGESIKYASEALRNDRDIVKAAIQCTFGALEYASEELRGDKAFILDQVAFCAVFDGYAYIADSLKTDREIAMLMVRNSGFSLRFLPDEFKEDWEVVFESVKQYVGALK